ncbi:MAG: hypothetical protein R3C45_13785 [Phycisphaerales bacterium]
MVNEYRRFCYLAIAAGHTVTPSDEVDQAWHLHLLYTRDYWEDFCPNVLGTPCTTARRGSKSEGRLRRAIPHDPRKLRPHLRRASARYLAAARRPLRPA